MKVAVPGSPRSGHKRREGEEFITYPDATIICGQAKYYKDVEYTVANPVALFEVLSPSTRIYDYTNKAEEYKKIPSLAYYIMLDSEQPRVECRRRGENNSWVEMAPQESLSETLKLLVSREITLSLAALYDGIIFEDADA